MFGVLAGKLAPLVKVNRLDSIGLKRSSVSCNLPAAISVRKCLNEYLVDTGYGPTGPGNLHPKFSKATAL